MYIRHLNCLPQGKVNLIVKDYKSGMPAREVAEKNQVAMKTVYQWLKRTGTTRRSSIVYDAELIELIDADYQSGMPIKELAKKYNKSLSAMNKVVFYYLDKRTDDHRGKNAKVIKMNLEGKTIKEYPSMIEASSDSGVTVKYIRQCCQGKRKQTKGYKYKWG